MATSNPFDILGDDDNDDPSHLIAVHQQKIASKKTVTAAEPEQTPAKLPTKPLPPAQAVREARVLNAAPSRGGGGVRGGRGRGGRGRGFRPNGNVEGFGGGERQERDSGKGSDREGGSYEGSRQPYGGGGYHRDGYGNSEAGGDGRPTRRVFDRRSGTGRGNEFKREGSGRGNWGTPTDEVTVQEPVEAVDLEDKALNTENQPDQKNPPTSETVNDNKDDVAKEEEKEEDKEMTLEEYEKIREEKRKALLSMKAKERKVDLDKEFKSMQQLSIKKENNDVFIKLGSNKDSRKKDHADKEDKAKKSVSINEFLKPAEGESYYRPGGRGRGRGRGDRGTYQGGFGRGGSSLNTDAAIKIEDPGQFPTLGGK